MAFTSPTGDIIVQEGTFAFDFTASGTIKAGQAVNCNDTMKVEAYYSDATKAGYEGCVGVAAYTQTDGKPIAVYGPGNIVRVIINGTAKCSKGQHLIPSTDGKFTWSGHEGLGHNASGVTAIALETQETDEGTARVLLI